MQYQEKQEEQKKSLCWKYSSFIICNCGKYLVCLLTHRTLTCFHLGEMRIPEIVPTKNAWVCQKHICTLQGIWHRNGAFSWIFDFIIIHRCCGWKWKNPWCYIFTQYNMISLKPGIKATPFDIPFKLAWKKFKKTDRIQRWFNHAGLWMRKNNIFQNTAWIGHHKIGRQYVFLMVSHRRKMEPVWMHILTLRWPVRKDCAFSEMDDTKAHDPLLLLRTQDVKYGAVWVQSLAVYTRIIKDVHD